MGFGESMSSRELNEDDPSAASFSPVSEAGSASSVASVAFALSAMTGAASVDPETVSSAWVISSEAAVSCRSSFWASVASFVAHLRAGWNAIFLGMKGERVELREVYVREYEIVAGREERRREAHCRREYLCGDQSLQLQTAWRKLTC